ncbi:MAG: DMT family transporter [Ignavibacteriaceae bacterium]|jgi:drug/metabolite transporter (DMT)-like permease|nr:DMT family transporter [Ignavibacteriaceae bacterium]
MPIGEISALATAFCWSITSYAFTNVSRRIGAIQVNIDRMVLASVMLISIVGVFGVSLTLSSDQISNLVISGILGLVLGDSFLFKSFQLIGARLGIIIMAAVPVLSTILAFFFLNEIISLLGMFGMLLTIVGILIVVLERKVPQENKITISKIGIFYGFLGALGQASGLIFAKFAFQGGELNGFAASFIRLFSASIIILPLAAIFRKYKNPFGIYPKDSYSTKVILIGTIFGPVLGITGSLIAIEYAKVGIASTLMATMPIIMLPISRFYFKEKLDWKAIIGAFVAVIGTAIIFLR